MSTTQTAATGVALEAPPIRVVRATTFPVWQLVALSFVVLAMYAQILAALVRQWGHDDNFSHGYLIPVFSLFIIWTRRMALAEIDLKPAWIGLGGIAAAMLMRLVGELGSELF